MQLEPVEQRRRTPQMQDRCSLRLEIPEQEYPAVMLDKRRIEDRLGVDIEVPDLAKLSALDAEDRRTAPSGGFRNDIAMPAGSEGQRIGQ